MALVRSAVRLDGDLQKDFTYIERRRDVKVSALGKVSVGPLRTFEVFPSAEPGQTYKRLIAIDGKPLDPAELRKRDPEHERDVEDEAQKRRAETPAQQARRLERAERERRPAAAILEDAFKVFEPTIVARETIAGESTIVVDMTPRRNARVSTREGGWMKEFQGRAWFLEEDGQFARLDMQAIDDVSVGWGIVGRLHKGSRIARRASASGSPVAPVAAHLRSHRPDAAVPAVRAERGDGVFRLQGEVRSAFGGRHSALEGDCRLPTADCDCRLRDCSTAD